MAAPTKAEREKCWTGRDELWKCLDDNNGDLSNCQKQRKLFEANCSVTWKSPGETLHKPFDSKTEENRSLFELDRNKLTTKPLLTQAATSKDNGDNKNKGGMRILQMAAEQIEKSSQDTNSRGKVIVIRKRPRRIDDASSKTNNERDDEPSTKKVLLNASDQSKRSDSHPVTVCFSGGEVLVVQEEENLDFGGNTMFIPTEKTTGISENNTMGKPGRTDTDEDYSQTEKTDGIYKSVRPALEEQGLYCCQYPQCHYKASKKPAFRRHIRLFHKSSDERHLQNLDNNNDDVSSSTKDSVQVITCDKCDGTFSNERSLANHQLRYHSTEHPKTLFPCKDCDRSFTLMKNLNRHIKLNHIYITMNKRSQCFIPDCSHSFFRRDDLIAHLAQDHEIQCEVENLEFDSLVEFKAWKAREEEKNWVWFKKNSGTKMYKNGVYGMTFYCQKEGNDRPHSKNYQPKEKSATRPSTRQTIKRTELCPARMVAKVDCNGHVLVQYCSTHSHAIQVDDLKTQPIPEAVTKLIKERLLSGVTISDIVDEMREGSDNGSNPKSRRHMITRGTVRSICSKLIKSLAGQGETAERLVQVLKNQPKLVGGPRHGERARTPHQTYKTDFSKPNVLDRENGNFWSYDNAILIHSKKGNYATASETNEAISSLQTVEAHNIEEQVVVESEQVVDLLHHMPDNMANTGYNENVIYISNSTVGDFVKAPETEIIEVDDDDSDMSYNINNQMETFESSMDVTESIVLTSTKSVDCSKMDEQVQRVELLLQRISNSLHSPFVRQLLLSHIEEKLGELSRDCTALESLDANHTSAMPNVSSDSNSASTVVVLDENTQNSSENVIVLVNSQSS